MGLTRPKIWDLDTNIQYFMDPITVLHAGATSANVDVGFLFNRSNGLTSNVAVYWSESQQSIITAFTANTGATDSNIAPTSYANLTIGNLLMVNGSILNVAGNINANTLGTHYGNVIGTTNGNIYVTGSVIPTANVAYDLGTATQRFRSLYLSGNTIDLGGATIKTDGVTGSIAIIPLATAANPNPVATIVSPTGTITTANTIGGNIDANTFSTAANVASTVTNFGNLTVGNLATVGNLITTAGVYWSNGVSALSSTYGNTQVAAYLLASPTITAIQANIGSYYTWANANAAGLSSQITGANAAIVTANSAVVSYVNSLNSAMAANIAGANAAIVTANSAVVSYVNSLNSAMAANIAGANAAIVTANSAVVSYVNTLVSSVATGGNANAAAYFTTASIGTTGTLSTSNSTNATGLGTGALNISQGGASIYRDLWVGGNIYANVLNTVSTQILQVNDPLLYLYSSTTYPYNYEIGVYSHFVGGPANVYAHTGLVRNHLDNTWYLFSNIPEPSGNTINLSSTAIVYDTLKLGNINAVSTVTVNGTELYANVVGLQNQITGANSTVAILQANVGSYYTWANANVAGLSNQISGANAAIVTANSAVVSYVNTLNSAMAANVAGANAAIVTANSAVVGYINSQITTDVTNWQANINAANAAIVTANTAVVSYVNTKINSLATGANANTAAYLATFSSNTQAGNTIVTGTANVGNVITTNGVFWANGVTALNNYSNTQVAAYLLTNTGNISAGNVIATYYGNAIGTTATYSGNVTAAYLIGNASALTGLTGVTSGTSNVSIPVANGNINLTAGGVTSMVVTSTGVVANGNVTTGNITTTGLTIGTGVSTTTVYPSGGSMSLTAASSQYVSYAANANFALTGNFTIECWVYITNFSATPTILDQMMSYAAGAGNWQFTVMSTTGLAFYYNGSTSQISGSGFSNNTWYHLAAVRSGTTLNFFVNGVSQGTATYSGTIGSNNSLYVGAQHYSGPQAFMGGYVNNVRIVNGTALYSANFTPPVSPLTAVANTVILANANSPSTFLNDSGPNNLAATALALPTFSNVTPLLGGSISFNGTSQYLSFPNSSSFAFGTGAFTIEGWINATSGANNVFILGGRSAITNMIITTGGYNGTTTAGALRYVGSSEISSGTTLVATGTWNHFAITRDASNNVKIYVNGVLSGSGTDTINYSTTTGTWYVASNDLARANFLPGSITDLRIVNGTAVYTGNFTPPVSQLTAIANTSLLLDSLTAGQYLLDSSVNNVTITNGGSAPFSSSTPYSSTALVTSGYLIPSTSANTGALVVAGGTGVSGNLYVGGNVVTTGNITGNYILGNGSLLTGLPATYGNTQMLANLAATGNPITIGSNLTVGGNLLVTGNITTQNYETITYTEIANAIAATGNISTTTNLIAPTYYGNVVGTAVTITGTVTASNVITTSGVFWANGTALLASVNTSITNVQANITGANAAIVTANSAVVSYVNTQITSLATGANANTAAYLTNATSNISTTANLSAGSNLIIGGNITRGATLVTDVANTINNIGTGTTAIDTFANTTIRSAKYVISTQDITTSQTQATEILLAQDGANVNIVTYGIVYTGTSSRMSFSANISSGTVTLWATGTSSNNTVKLSRTAVPM